jgi:hypothetical protein
MIGGAVAMSSDFVFWAKNYAWAGLTQDFTVAPCQYSIRGNNRGLNFNLTDRVTKPSNQQLVWDIDLDAPNSTIGGGLAFRPDVANLEPNLAIQCFFPTIAVGFWGKKSRAEMRFDPPLPAVYFESGRKTEIRAHRLILK